MNKRHVLLLLLPFLTTMVSAQKSAPPKQKNIIFILADDHRYDAMGFMKKNDWAETPNLDRLAREGKHLKNAFVSTALCSPSRASILTGQYAHKHTVVDNTAPEPTIIEYFPQLLQKANYQTAFFGKWHMGNDDDHPRKGFHHWEGLKGQGEYYNPSLNIDGQRIQFKDSTYVADLLTDHAIDWLNKRSKDKPFFVYLSHKGVHAPFQPAKRHNDRYKNKPVPLPPSYSLTATDEYKKHNIPEWVKEQRHSWHGVDYMYHGQIDFDTFYRKYFETLLSVDESVGKVMDYLKANGLEENTMVIYMGDNGFSFGEHGLIDKRHAYEESMRVPLLIKYPAFVAAGSSTDAMVQNVDIAPTLLELAGIPVPKAMQGKSFLEVLKGNATQHKDQIFYEYYWEYAFPQTPTMFSVRTEQYKYIHYYGLWTQNELYDLKKDPNEMNNLIADPEYRELSKQLSTQLFDWLETTGGMQIPLKRNDVPKFDNKNSKQY
ncbi:Arylsulfatase A [Chryseolinea serpens]|uniref:Arylsulfatase A n=1 Tax=Chryseolinea serpens TaxID=947013 RepID=A0A1M5MT55_9BACT|nr:sulfatase [Chryseolinea serpens]SHG80570.1 Arylsulfatase A [Chryseolinea serpens]